MKKIVFLSILVTIGQFIFSQPAPENLTAYRNNNGTSYTFNVTGATNGRIWGGANNIYTDDSHVATAAVHSGVLKPGEQAIVTVLIMEGQTSYPALSRNGVTSIAYGAWSGSYKVVSKSSSIISNPVAVNGPDNLTAYSDKKGTTYLFKVKGSNDGRIWGGENGVYTDDSYLPLAAVHCGALQPGQEGVIKVTIMEGLSSYPSLTKNGVSSIAYGPWTGSYKIALSTAGNIIPAAVQGPENLTAYRNNNGTVYTFKVKGSTAGRIWGGSNNIYTDDSQLATAAVHCGVLKPGEEADIKVMVVEGQNAYPAITRNGVVSIVYGAWGGSYKIIGK